MGHLSVNIHSPVNGKVVKIDEELHPILGKADAVVIETDGFDQDPPEYIERDYSGFSRQELINIIKEAGIVGLGGAGFPAYAKLSFSKDIKIDTLIINGAECEPYLTSDHRNMLEYPYEIIKGCEVLLKILEIDNCIIGIEKNKTNVIKIFENQIEKLSLRDKIKIKLCKVKYPQGSEKQLIKSLVNREVPPGKFPFHIGVVVHNVTTTKSIYDAVILNKPLYEKSCNCIW